MARNPGGREHDDFIETVPSRLPPPIEPPGHSMLTIEGQIAQRGDAARAVKSGLHDRRRWVRWTARGIVGMFLAPLALVLLGAVVEAIGSLFR